MLIAPSVVKAGQVVPFQHRQTAVIPDSYRGKMKYMAVKRPACMLELTGLRVWSEQMYF